MAFPCCARGSRTSSPPIHTMPDPKATADWKSDVTEEEPSGELSVIVTCSSPGCLKIEWKPPGAKNTLYEIRLHPSNCKQDDEYIYAFPERKQRCVTFTDLLSHQHYFVEFRDLDVAEAPYKKMTFADTLADPSMQRKEFPQCKDLQLYTDTASHTDTAKHSWAEKNYNVVEAYKKSRKVFHSTNRVDPLFPKPNPSGKRPSQDVAHKKTSELYNSPSDDNTKGSEDF